MSKSRTQRYEEQFGSYADFIREQHCCGCGAWPPSDPHHVRSRGAGGDWRQQVPLCRICHTLCHRLGVVSFQRLRGINFTLIREKFLKLWEERDANQS